MCFQFAPMDELDNFKCDMEEVRKQGVDLPESNDPREVVQNIMFKQHTTILGKEAMDIKKRESLKQWAAMWLNINEQAEEEMKQPSQDVVDESQVGTSSTPQLHDVAEFKRVAVLGLLSGIADELKKAEKDVRGLLEVIQNAPQDKLEPTLHAKLIALSGIVSCSPEKVIPGEWINIALGRVLAMTEKSKLRSLNTVLKIILMKLVPYDMSFPKPMRVHGDEATAATATPQPEKTPEKSEAIALIVIKPQSDPEEGSDTQHSGRQGKLDVGKYYVRSKVNKDGKRFWPCPYENCLEYFGSSRKCGAHLNEHLGRIYVCDKCKYETYSLDLYDHHICFSGPKTQSGTTCVGMKYKKRVEDKGEVSTSGQKRRGDCVSDIPVKREKEDDEDIIVLD